MKIVIIYALAVCTAILVGCATGPTFMPGQTTMAQMNQQLGEPITKLSLPNGVTRVRWGRTWFHGATMSGETINEAMTFYDGEFGPDNVLKAWRPVDKSVSLDNNILFGN